MSIAHKKAFSLIEVLIFVTILSIFLIAAASIVTLSMRQNTLRIHMLKATHYNSQLLEWLKGERDIDWKSFVMYAQNKSRCYTADTFSSATTVSEEECLSGSGFLDGLYKRYAVFTTSKNSEGVVTQVAVEIHTQWQESGGTYTTKLNSIFTLWE